MASTKPVEARPLHDHLARNAAAGAGLQMVITLLVAAMATSRATHHVLSPAALAIIVAASAATGALVSWPNGLHAGARDFLSGQAVLECEPNCPAEVAGDPFEIAGLRRTTAAWALLVGVWAGAGGALVAAALGGKQARFIVVYAALAGLAGLAGVVIDTVARHRGAHAARRLLTDPPRPENIRQRGWHELALPLAVTQVLVNGGMAWVLFHNAHPLTRANALADVAVIAILVSAIFGSLAAGWGDTDAALGRILLDDPDHQQASAKSPIGWQGFVYIVVFGIIAGQVAAFALPTRPSLWEVAVARAAIGGLLAYLATGAGYVRGALNGKAVR